jgi:hypothetical protein
MGLKRLELFTDYELQRELAYTDDELTRKCITKLLAERSKQRVQGNKELFKDSQGRIKPGYMTTGELFGELDAEPEGTDRYESLAIEAKRRMDWRAFPRQQSI